MNIIESIIIAIVEGITEYIPISSTGHMIITEKLLGVEENDFVKVFTVAIQLGAILSVLVLYRKKFFDLKNISFYLKLAIGVIPAIVLGFLFSKKIDALLDSSTTVALALLLGGILLLFIDNVFTQNKIHNEKELSFLKAFIIGCWQCLAMVPGVSRSAASIIGGMQQQLTRHAAAEFSFFLAVPTMLAASGYKLFKYYRQNAGFSNHELQLLAIGNLVAFIVALLAIKFFIGFLQKHGFKVWGIYRIILGVLLLALIYKGYLPA
ncbi:MAG TPA: undecaprenyl-diphosphate phosphatase [Ferruginibacter sp.]|nr:undecaprenyl-diphosphate phosphatase [Bacteroidota bacterium]MBS1926502.1 undecaprenyl-diphosphate phosphatase [Bacteroidota bacterium]HMT95933.1 undecaprenyl-diphosphate phosphatase [Ferruginibacter sp.]HMU23448.1 undecaprenyl-diphosphate phosphatase [Ferruginibacter sp.]